MTVLEVDDAGRVFGSGRVRVTALDGVSLRVSAGEFVAVMGPSGSGKSTLLRLAGGLERPTSGRVLLAGRDLAALDEAGLAEVRRRQVGFVFQESNLLAALTAAENVALALELDGVRPRAAMAGASGLLEKLGLAEAGHRFPGELSGGEQQRVAIARAVAKRPDVLLCDEPTGALDAETGKVVLEVIDRVNRELHTTVAIITHNAVIGQMADRVISMHNGKISHVTHNAERARAEGLVW
jgi:putative ABC transport system ATP-binding protein